MRTAIAIFLVLGGLLAAPSCGYNYDALMGDSGGTGAGGQGASQPVAGNGGNANVAGTGGQPSPTGTAGLSGSAGAGVGAGGGVEPTGAAGNAPGGTRGTAGSGAVTGTAGVGGIAGSGHAGAAGGGAAGKGAAGASGSSGHGGSAGSSGAAGHGGAAGGSAGATGRGGSGGEVGLPTPYLRYTFDQTSGTKITDVTGHNHDATVVGTAVGFGNGIIGNDLSLNGTVGNYVSVPNGIVQPLTDVTIAFWVLIHSDTATDRWQRVFDFGSNTNQNMYFVPHSNYTDAALFAITTGGVNAEQRLTSPGPVPVNSWTHVVIVLSAGTGTIYINSIPTGTNYAMSLTPSSLGATSNNTLGRSQYSPDPPFNGEIDDFRIYSTALNPGQVSTLFMLR